MSHAFTPRAADACLKNSLRGTLRNAAVLGTIVIFASPISISPNTTYIAAYFVKGGHYAGDTTASLNAVTSGPLTAIASRQAGGNGVYNYGTSIAFPNQTYFASNYWVDVAFTPSAPPLNMSFNPPNPSITSNAALVLPLPRSM